MGSGQFRFCVAFTPRSELRAGVRGAGYAMPTRAPFSEGKPVLASLSVAKRHCAAVIWLGPTKRSKKGPR